MRLVYLYGPPSVGKLTVARELTALTGFKLFHNHLTVNLLTAVFPFGSEAFRTLLRQFRQGVFAEAARADIDLVFTSVYPGTPEQSAGIRAMIDPVYANGGAVLFVKLTCDPETWLARIPNESRRHKGKLTDPERVLRLFNGGDPFATLPFEPSLTLDTTHRQPAEVARQIVEHYKLPLVAAAAPAEHP